MRVKQMISALPGYGFKKTQALMHALSIADSKRVGGLGVKQAHALILARPLNFGTRTVN